MKLISRLSTLSQRQRVATFTVLAVFAVGAAGVPLVRADQFQAQIDSLNQQNAETRVQLDQLGNEAASFQDQIGKLQAQINALQEQIKTNQQKSEDLQRQIVAAEEELTKQKRILGESIKQMYIEGQISTLEMLASSKDLSEFVDKQQYRDSVQNKIKTTLDKITALKLQLKNQKEEVEKLLADLKNMQGQLAAQQAEQSRLLAMNQAQQNELDSKLRENSARVTELKRQQAAAIAAANRSGRIQIVPSSGNGGYPAVWANAPQDSLVDSWGMYNRECVSYAAFKVWATGKFMPYWGGVGNAFEWPGNARRAGIPVNTTPKVGSIAYMDIGYYGHVMYVEAVLDGGAKILVSQYNWSPGAYSEMIISTSGLQFIHFQ